jgi:hypothetical protein
MPKHVLVLGPGRCGLTSVTELLNRQPSTKLTQDDPPLLPWKSRGKSGLISERFARFRRDRSAEMIGDTAAFYLPYVEEAVSADPGVRVVGLRRPREEIVASFCGFLDRWNLYPTNHWSIDPGIGFHHDPLWTQTFPQYENVDRLTGLRRYCDEYYSHLESLTAKYPENVRVFDMHQVLNTENGQRQLLDFLGYSRNQQVLVAGIRGERKKPKATRPQGKRSGDPLDPGRCVILVPFGSYIHPACDHSLRELERRGYQVRRVGGQSAIDQARNCMATEAILDGFEETMWIDSDIEFHPDSIKQLRAHGLPVTCGIYPKKGVRGLSSNIIPGTPKMVFGPGGGVIEIQYAATGFLLVRRGVYLSLQIRLGLPVCNERFDAPVIPFFQPMLHPIEDGHWYLAEDYSFSQRVRSIGYNVVADTTIRLWHLGGYRYGWEDAGNERERTESYTLHFPDKLQKDGKR